MQGRLAAAVLVVGVLVADGAGFAYVRTHRSRSVSAPAAITSIPPTTAASAGEMTLSGTLTDLHAQGATGGPIPEPFTVSIPARGAGEVNIERVTYQGTQGATVAWDGGQPLPFAGDGALVLGPATLDANAAGITWHLDGAPRLLAPGRYTAGSSVAVGVEGLAQPLDQATFTVAPGAAGILVSVGDAQVHGPPAAEHITGPGIIELLGSLRLTTPTGARSVHDLHFGSGSFDVRLQPVAGGYAVSGVLRGPITLLR